MPNFEVTYALVLVVEANDKDEAKEYADKTIVSVGSGFGIKDQYMGYLSTRESKQEAKSWAV